mmetsp:Transcript_4149/g.10035  ORF Transcript_4149/g.10035 Transcript_4149/m.10035 type:complete len:257 (-) Transcript_4149:496-1266(-)
MPVTPIIPCMGVRNSCVNVTMESPIAFASIASSRAVFSATSRARSAVIFFNTTKNLLLSSELLFVLLYFIVGDEYSYGETSRRKIIALMHTSISLLILENALVSFFSSAIVSRAKTSTIGLPSKKWFSVCEEFCRVLVFCSSPLSNPTAVGEEIFSHAAFSHIMRRFESVIAMAVSLARSASSTMCSLSLFSCIILVRFFTITSNFSLRSISFWKLPVAATPTHATKLALTIVRKTSCVPTSSSVIYISSHATWYM